MNPVVSLIIVNYNAKKLLKICLDSIFNLNYPKKKLEVIVVDNGSYDGSVEFTKINFPQVKLIDSPANNYCLANNLGIREAKGKYIGLVNNDVQLEKEWLNELIKPFPTNEHIGAVSGKILFPDKKINSTGHKRLPDYYWADRGFGEKDRGQYNRSEELESFSHCACLYDRACLEEIGFLDKSFNMFLEDVDMSIRAREKGWMLLYQPSAVCIHNYHGSVEGRRLRFYIERNRLFLIAKHYPDRLREALFNNGYFSIAGKADCNFYLSVLDELKDRFTGLSKGIVFLQEKIKNFHRNKIYKFFVRSLWRITGSFFRLGGNYHNFTKKKVLHIIGSYPPEIGGAGIWCKDMCNYLSEKGYLVTVLTSSCESGARPVEETENIKVIRYKRVDSEFIKKVKAFRGSRGYDSLRFAWENSLGVFFSGPHSMQMYMRMFREIKSSHIVHLHILPYLYNFLGFALAKFYGKKVMITPYFHKGNPEHERKINFWLMKRCDAVFAITDCEKRYLSSRGVDENKIHVRPCAIDLADYQPQGLEQFKETFFKKYGFEDNAKVVVFIGRKMQYKGIKELVEAIKRLKQQMPVKLILIGPGSFWFKYFYHELSNEDKTQIIDLGVVTHREKVNLLHLSDLLALPSRYESFGTVFLEAWACGLPVVGTKEALSASMIEGAGLTVGFGDINDLTEKINIILSDKLLADNLSAEGRQRLNNYLRFKAKKSVPINF